VLSMFPSSTNSEAQDLPDLGEIVPAAPEVDMRERGM
jgi:hypothetical protein